MHSLAYTPPPLSLKDAPNEFVWGERTPQPWLPVDAAAQTVPPTRVPEIPRALELEVARVHPGAVWIVAWLFV